ncbi:MAG: DUF2997 domain-containing protein [Methanoregula sp.]|nr:MAG: DUF2997 domain-containing protein [Methanoregula sp.]
MNLLEPQELEIIINREGNIEVRVRGSKGDQCLEITRGLEESIGKLEQREYSPEYYEERVVLHDEGTIPIKR